MAKKIISILLVCVIFLTSCKYQEKKYEETEEIKVNKSKYNNNELESDEKTEDEVSKSLNVADQITKDVNFEKFYNLNDEELLQYVEDQVYANMTENFASEDYKIESVDAIYISKEYIEELKYNSKENIYFGYTLSELDSQYSGERYVFTLGDNGKTVTKVFEKYDDTYDKIIKNVVTGAGLIIICVTVSVISGGLGAPPCVTMVFAASAKTGASFAASTGLISSAGTAIVKGIETKNVEETLKAAALSGSEGFKWGAITGVVAGGAAETLSLVKSARTIPGHRESELKVLEMTKKGEEQISYLNGEKVLQNTKGCTRPDVIIENADGSVKAIEVKNYNLETNKNLLVKEVKRQVESRVKNLPNGSTQEIVLDIRGRKYSKDLINEVIESIKLNCNSFYPDIPVKTLLY